MSLSALVDKHPQIAAALRVAEQRRADRLATYLYGARLQGLQQLCTYLDAAAKSYSDSPPLPHFDSWWTVCLPTT